MDAQEFISLIEGTLQEKPSEALGVLRDPRYIEICKNSSWQLVPRLCANLTDDFKTEKNDVYTCSIELLMEIAESASPEDIFFEFIAQTENINTDSKFIIILRAIKIILMRIPHRRGTAMEWCCNAIARHISRIHLPQNAKLEGEEQLLLENQKQFQAVEEVYLEILDFFLPFIREVEEGKFTVPEKHIEVYRHTILKSLFKLLGNPLASTYLECKKNKGTFRSIAESILSYINCFHLDLFSFLDFVGWSSHDAVPAESEFSNLSLGVFYYLVLVEGLYIEKTPCVYSNIYLIKKLLWLSISLMNTDDASVQWKGLLLTESALGRINDKEIVFENIDRCQCKEFALLCCKLMVYSDSKNIRGKAVIIFCKFLRIFDARGRYYMLMSIQDVVKEPGFVGFLVTKVKDFISEALCDRDLEELKYFSGKALQDLIKKLCNLENDTETDIMRHADQIIPCLNLLRYLIIRDKDNNSGIFDLVPTLENSYFTPLKKAIELSRAHYVLQKKEMGQPPKAGSIETTVKVGELELPQLSNEQTFQVIDSALNIFDLIDSLLNRVIECINENRT